MSGNSFLIKFSGKDHLILRYSTEVEKTAYSCLGLLVISMSLIAFLSMLFALDLIYFPEGYTPHQLLTSFDFYLSLTISFIWALIVYNFFRLTVSAHSIDAERFRLANLPRIFLKSLFGIVLGVSVSIPVSISFLHKDVKNSLLTKQRLELVKFFTQIDDDHNQDLIESYKKYVELNETAKSLLKRKDVLTSFSKGDNDQLNQTLKEIEINNAQSNDIKQKITEQRNSILKEKKDLEDTFISNDSLLTNAQKAFEDNIFLVSFLVIFIVFIFVFPALYFAIFVPGLYDYLVEWSNVYCLVKQGVLPFSTRVFINGSSRFIPYYYKAEEILRLKKYQVFSLIKNQNKKLDAFKLNSGSAIEQKFRN